MRRLFRLIVVFIVLFVTPYVLTSCKDSKKETSVQNNTLTGTTWMAMDGTYRVTFKFFSESTLEVSFSSLSDGDIESSIGNCVFVDPNITITCFDDDFFTGVVSGNQMILYYFGEDRMVFTRL